MSPNLSNIIEYVGNLSPGTVMTPGSVADEMHVTHLEAKLALFQATVTGHLETVYRTGGGRWEQKATLIHTILMDDSLCNRCGSGYMVAFRRTSKNK